jgi:hypothetical protein
MKRLLLLIATALCAPSLLASADLSITASLTDGQFLAGTSQDIYYSIHNAGPDLAPNVILTFTVLAGRIAASHGDFPGAIAEYTTAVAKEDALDYDEPTDWFYPTRETLGATLLRDERNAAAAEKVFRADLARTPHNPRSLLGLAAALRAQKKDASAVTAEFGRVWEGGS